MHSVKKLAYPVQFVSKRGRKIFLLTDKITLTDVVLCESGSKVGELRRTVASSPSTKHQDYIRNMWGEAAASSI